MKKFKSFKDFVKEDRGIEVPEIEEEIIEEEEEVKTVDDGIKEFRKIAHESAVEDLEEQKQQNIPVPVVVTAEQVKRNNRILIVDQINEVLKHRDPILEKMTFEEWVKDPFNKIINGLSDYHTQRLYEQDMDRADKVQAAGRTSGGGVRKRKVTTEAVTYYWTPDALVTSADCAWFQASDLSGHNVSVSNWSPTATTITSTVAPLGNSPSYTQPVLLDGVTPGSPTPFGAKPHLIFGYDGTFGNGAGGNRSSLIPSADQGWDIRAYNSPLTIFVCYATVASPVNSGVTSALYARNGYSSYNNWDLIGVQDDGRVRASWADSNLGFHDRLTGQTYAGRHAIGFSVDGVTGSPSTSTAYHNGAAHSRQNSYANSSSNYFLAAHSDIVMGWEIYVTEVVWLNYEIDPADVTLLEAYWAAKYGALAV